VVGVELVAGVVRAVEAEPVRVAGAVRAAEYPARPPAEYPVECRAQA